MDIKRIYLRVLTFFLVFLIAVPLPVFAQNSEEMAQSRKFSKEELAQMLAPVALYPDALLGQILMASTYPLEVVQADRWVNENKSLIGDQLDAALLEKTWDPSVKSLCHFSSVLASMNDHLEQTEKIGDAFLGQEKDVMDSIQELRLKARAQGNLKTTKEQKVVVEDEKVIIEPANSRIVYVPVYNPFVVYGPWWYPAYPPYYWYYPGPVIAGPTIGFSIGIAVGIGLLTWALFDWHTHVIHVDTYRISRFHRVSPRFEGRQIWRHDVGHRRGVAYRDRTTSVRFGQTSVRGVSRPEARGHMERQLEQKPREVVRGFPERRRIESSPQPEQRPSATRDHVRTGPVESGTVTKPQVRDQGAFEGIDNGSHETKAGRRGFRSRRNPTNGVGDVGPAPGNVGKAPGDVGRAPGNVGPAPGDVGRAPGDVGRAPGDVSGVVRGRIREGGRAGGGSRR